MDLLPAPGVRRELLALENPILTQDRLRYPLGVDLLTAVFVQLGLRLELVLPALGLAGAALAALALRLWGRAFGVAGFLLAGGLAGFAPLLKLGLSDVDAQVAWKNLFLALLVPQRGFLLALPVGLVLLWSWRAQLLRGERAPLGAWTTGLLWGALPLVHLHTFAFVSVTGGLWAIASGRWRAALPGLGAALVPATWAVLQVTDGFRAARLVGWAPGWVIGDENIYSRRSENTIQISQKRRLHPSGTGIKERSDQHVRVA